MIAKICVFLVFLLFLVPVVSAELEFDNVKSYDEQTKTITIKDNFGLGGDLVKATLLSNTYECGSYCSAEKNIILYDEGVLIKDVRFYRLFADGSKELSRMRSYGLQYYGEIPNYEVICNVVGYASNGSEIKECKRELIGSRLGWSGFQEGQVFPAGNYIVKLEGTKKPHQSFDWQVEMQGKWTTEWATWGNISLGDDAEVILNSPADDSTEYNSANVTFDASANVTGGSSLINMSLYGNISGSWVRNVTVTMDFPDIEITNTGWADGGGSSVTFLQGVKFSVYNDTTLTNATKYSSATSETLCALYFANLTNIQNASYSGDVCSFSPQPSLKNGQTYYLLSHAGGASRGQTRDASPGYPKLSSQGSVNITTGYSSNVGDDGATAYYLTDFAFGEETTSNTQIFYMNVPKGTTLWNVQGCDSGGGCGFAPANFTFNLDSTSPTIFVDGGNGTLDFGDINVNHTLNYTITDTNLDSCLLEYDSSNRTIPCTSGSTNTTNFTLTSGVNSAVIYANDSLNNLGAKSVSWSFDVLQNSFTHNSTSFETENETFYVNITTNGTAPTNANLVYNATPYTATITNTAGDFYNLSTTIDIPLGITNNTFYFNFTISGTDYNTTQHQQNVSETLFILSNATYPYPFLNITFQDEDDLSYINASISTSTFYYWLGSGTVNKTLTYVNTTDNYDYPFASSVNRTLFVNATVQYKQGTAYPQRIWQPATQVYTNTTTEQILYLLGSTDGLYVTFQVINTAEQSVSGVDVNGTRLISGSEVTIAVGTTNDAGAVTFWLNPDFSHTFGFSRSGYNTFITSLFPTQSTYTITLGTSAVGNVSDYTRGVNYTIQPPTSTILTNGTDYTFNFSVTSTYWTVDQFGFELLDENRSSTNVTSATTNGGTLNIVLNTGANRNITMEYYWLINGNFTNASVFWVVWDDTGVGYGIGTFLDDVDTYVDTGLFGLDNFGLSLIVFVIIFITAGVMSYNYGITSPAAIAFIVLAMVYFFDVQAGWLPQIGGFNHLPTVFMSLIAIALLYREVTR